MKLDYEFSVRSYRGELDVIVEHKMYELWFSTEGNQFRDADIYDVATFAKKHGVLEIWAFARHYYNEFCVIDGECIPKKVAAIAVNILNNPPDVPECITHIMFYSSRVIYN